MTIFIVEKNAVFINHGIIVNMIDISEDEDFWNKVISKGQFGNWKINIITISFIEWIKLRIHP